MRNAKKTIVVVALIALMAIPSMFAYFTDKSEVLTNTFTVGNVEIKLEELAWDALVDNDANGTPDEAEIVVPHQEIAKDPTVTNIGDNAAYVFIQLNETNKDAYALNIDTGNWTETAADSGIYYYGTAGKMTALEAGDPTPALFDTVTIDGGVTEETAQWKIVATAFAVQTTGIADTDVTGAWDKASAAL